MDKSKKILLFLMAVVVAFYSLSAAVFSTPDGVTVTHVTNLTRTVGAGTIVNQSTAGISGGYIFIMNLSGDSQNARWKAFAGNVSGKLTLDDANSNTIYDWSFATISGEIYATRHSASVNWSGINCAPLNATETENINLSHTNKDDNISATFVTLDNQAMTVGSVSVKADTCRTINVYQNSQDTGGAGDVFEELILYDRGNFSWDQNQTSFGKIVYAQNLQGDTTGFDNVNTFDFQLIVPERGSQGWSSSTPYYFYMELS